MNIRVVIQRLFIAALVVSVAPFAASVFADSSTGGRDLADDTAQFRRDVLDINRRLLLMEEELLFPADTRVAIFVSLDVGRYFTPDAVTLKLGGNTLVSHLYTEREIRALKNGAVQRLHTANVRNGAHELTAFVTGIGPNGREIRRAATLNFDKASGQHFIQLRLEDDAAAQQPTLTFRAWQ
ncbi:hypothetical protein [Alcanivorax limicola]|uniref:hypothetical protein n=1 Tax=Alcanivorax limicola TaxID=2874102 RepID=UPI001CC09F72|nr:hypothetical protein [Alcanivorax limicola]